MATALPEVRWYHVGPHGIFDLIRLARSGRGTFVRIGYILILFAALAISFYSSTPPDGRNRDASLNWNARIAERFSATILVMQNIAVLVLTPIYMVASIQEERDRQTLQILFTTQLTAREIVAGKWLSRCAQVGSVLLAGLPVLAVVQLWGGIDMPIIVANFVVTAMLLLTVGAFGLMMALQYPSMLAALLRCYSMMAGAVLVLGMTMSCFGGMVLLVLPVGGSEGSYSLMWVGVAFFGAVCLPICLVTLDYARELLDRARQERPPRVVAEPGIDPRRNRFWRWPAIPDAIVAWKECYLDRSVFHIMPFAVLPLLVVLLCVHLVVVVAHGVGDLEGDRFSIVFLLGCLGTYILLVALRMTGSIVRERQQRTLETLLTAPTSSREFLQQKLIGNLRRHWTWLVPAGLAWLMLIAFGSERLAVGLVLPTVFGVHLAFFAMLGLYLSVRCQTALSAYVSFGLITALLVFGLPLFSAFVDMSPTMRIFERTLNPWDCWLVIVFYSGREMLAVFVCTLLYVAMALTLWIGACRRFARDPLGS